MGAGGAGSAIAHSLILAGVKELAIHDENTERRDSLINRLNSLKQGRVFGGSSNPSGFDVAINATPVGMQENDSNPIDIDAIMQDMFIGCVITAPAIPPLGLLLHEQKDATPRLVQTCSCKSANSWSSSC